jgi:aryl-alcohol dehydrogenase-like predicted oxidoreductase
MEYTILGRAGLRVSVAGLGCGGPSRLGLRDGADSTEQAVALIRQAFDLGVNLFDTAEAYGTETVVGRAIKNLRREDIVISSKKTIPPTDANPEKAVRRGLEQSLTSLGTDYIDIYHLHGVEPKDYEYATNRLLPVMRQLKEEGKIRSIGVSEAFVQDQRHRMLQDSLKHDLWDVVMVGFNLLNPSARNTVFPLTRARGVGVLNMFAVRRALSQPKRLKELVVELLQKGEIPPGAVNPDDPLEFVYSDGDALTLPEAAYRFCRHEPGVDVVLTGTGNPAHLQENIASILKPPLPRPVLDRLGALFGKLDYLTGN